MKDIRKEIERVIATIDFTLEQSKERAEAKGEFWTGSIFGPEVRKALVEVLEITKVTNENGDVLDPIYDVHGHLTAILMNCDYLLASVKEESAAELVRGIQSMVTSLLEGTEAEPDPCRQVFVATKTEKHPDKFVTYLGAFLTYEAAQKACDEDGEKLFGGHPLTNHPDTRNHQRFYYYVEEMKLKS